MHEKSPRVKLWKKNGCHLPSAMDVSSLSIHLIDLLLTFPSFCLGVGRLQFTLEPSRVRRCEQAVRPLHLAVAARYCPL